MAKWYVVPLILWLVLVIGLTFELSALVLPYVNEWLKSIPGLDMGTESKEFWGAVKSFFAGGLSFTVALLIKILIWYILGRYMKYVVLILLSPLLAYLSEITEEKQTGRTFPFNLSQFISDVIRGIGITLRNMIYETFLMGAGLLLSFFIPVLAPFVTLFLFFVNCYFMGFNFFDYAAERHKMSVAASVQFMRRNMSLLTGFGFAYNLVSALPLLDWIVAPVGGAIGSSLAVCDMGELNSQNTDILKV